MHSVERGSRTWRTLSQTLGASLAPQAPFCWSRSLVLSPASFGAALHSFHSPKVSRRRLVIDLFTLWPISIDTRHSSLVTHLCPGVSAIANPQLPFFHSRSYSYSHPSIHYSLLSLFNTTEIVSTCFYLDLKTNPRWLVSLRLFVTSRHVSLDRGYTTPATDTPHAICMDSYVWFSSS